MSVSLDAQKSNSSLSLADYDVVVVGAGPYGLSTAAHLLERGLNVAIYGKPLSFWRENMPRDMLLRSYWWASNLSDPQKQYGLARYFQENGMEAYDPLPAKTFIAYGLWFQKQLVPNIDETFIKTVELKEGRFILTLTDGRVIRSSAVVMAPGLGYYTYRPPEYNHLGAELVTHTAEHQLFDRFAGKQVIIIGGGQSALETAALAHESGAHVHLVSRSPLTWIKGSGSFPEHRPLMERLRNPKAGISPGWFNWRLEHFPYLFQRLPRSTKDRLLDGPGRNGPIGAAWLKPRIEGKVFLHELQHVQAVREMDDGVVLSLSNNEKLKADHVILGTGYHLDIRKLPMLHPQLLTNVQTYQNAPILNNRFESSVQKLYFVGYSSLLSFGPLYRFVVGTDAAARRVADSVAKQVGHTKYQKLLRVNQYSGKGL
jgi:thioredoxin reductase